MKDTEIAKLQALAQELAEKNKRLEKSVERLGSALDGSGLGLWDWNIQTHEVIFNDTWGEMLGFLPHEISPSLDEWLKRIHPDDKIRVRVSLQRHLNGETPYYECAHRLRTKSGGWKWILDRGKVIEHDSDGRPLRATGTHRDITREKEFEQQLFDLARRDSLTGLGNRRSLEEFFKISRDSARRYGREIALFYIDIDGFKQVNDTIGHKAGDDLLKIIGDTIRRTIRKVDRAFRVGGDEFVILVPEYEQVSGLEKLARRVISRINAPVSLNGTAVEVGVSIGIALSGASCNNLEDLLEEADEALIEVKGSGKNDFKINSKPQDQPDDDYLSHFFY